MPGVQIPKVRAELDRLCILKICVHDVEPVFQSALTNAFLLKTQNENKVWGMGSGYFGYEFELPENLNPDEVESIEFRAELASRYPQSKYLEEGEAERIGMTIVSEKGGSLIIENPFDSDNLDAGGAAFTLDRNLIMLHMSSGEKVRLKLAG